MPSLNIGFAGTGETVGRTGVLFLLSQSRDCTGIRSLLFCSALDSLQFKHPMETHSKYMSKGLLSQGEKYLFLPTLCSVNIVKGVVGKDALFTLVQKIIVLFLSFYMITNLIG
jgi:hypothetical protein